MCYKVRTTLYKDSLYLYSYIDAVAVRHVSMSQPPLSCGAWVSTRLIERRRTMLTVDIRDAESAERIFALRTLARLSPA